MRILHSIEIAIESYFLNEYFTYQKIKTPWKFLNQELRPYLNPSTSHSMNICSKHRVETITLKIKVGFMSIENQQKVINIYTSFVPPKTANT